MKKITCFTCILFSLLFSLASCGKKRIEPYTSFVQDSIFDTVQRTPGEPLDKLNTTTFQKSRKKNRSVTFDGKEYSVSYQKTEPHHCAGPSEVDCYISEDGSDFGFRSDTGELVYWDKAIDGSHLDEYFLDDVEKPAETAERIADNFARAHLNDFDRYEKSTRDPQIWEREIDGKHYEFSIYSFIYTKRIAGRLTNDTLTVSVTSRGNLSGVFFGYVGDYDRADLTIDEEKLSASILEKARATYENSGNFSPREYEIAEQTIILTYDGYYAVKSKVNTTGTFDTGSLGLDENYTTGLIIYTVLK